MERFEAVSFDRVSIEGGFWKEKQDMNARRTIPAVRDRFRETGRFDAFRLDWKEGMPNMPSVYWSGDIEKWIESVSYLPPQERSPALEAEVDRIADLVEKGQSADGYFNIWHQLFEPGGRFTNRDRHELYAAGHLMEAAVAYYDATGKDKLLRCACRYADYIRKVFAEDRSAAFATPGHEEIELALVKLYRCTGEKRYLELARHFIEERGKHAEDLAIYTWNTPCYGQSHLPVREQKTAEGHAVRATYLYAGMADIAYEYGDESLLDACRTLFGSIADRRMYINGGIGSSARGEAFTIDYDLPSLTAYSETCAAIGLIFFASRMLRMDPDSRYADGIERVLYNGFLSGVSLDGTSFFYENPLEADPALIRREPYAREQPRLPAPERVSVFACSCCPPNITRLIASAGGMLYTYGGGTLYVHQFMDGTASFGPADSPTEVTQRADYPRSGTVHLSVRTGSFGRLAVRIPGWCGGWSAETAEGPLSYTMEKGYAIFLLSSGQTELTLRFDMRPVFIEASPRVRECAGRAALQRGPVVYCLEEADNGKDLRDIRIDPAAPVTEEDSAFFGLPVLRTCGTRRDPAGFRSLYRPLAGRTVRQELLFIPYYGYANRGANEMIVWVDV